MPYSSGLTREGPTIGARANGADRVRRLGAGGVDGTQQPTLRNRSAVRAARWLDAGLGRLRAARPVALVSGFWRSGTTWVQECLAESLDAKTVFEPLSPNDARRRAMLRGRFPGEDAAQAHIPGPGLEGQTWAFLDDAVSGRYGSAFLLSCRSRVADSLRRAVVVKDVRLQFNLGAAHRRWRVPVIHVRRHPHAAVASLWSADWHWSFERVRLADVLQGLGAALPPGYPAGDALLAEFDTDGLSRIAAAWAVTERFVDLSLSGEPWARIVAYEDLLAAPEDSFAELCGWLGRRRARVPSHARRSASSAAPAPAGRVRQDRWREILSAREVARVGEIVGRLYPEYAVSLAGTR